MARKYKLQPANVLPCIVCTIPGTFDLDTFALNLTSALTQGLIHITRCIDKNVLVFFRLRSTCWENWITVFLTFWRLQMWSSHTAFCLYCVHSSDTICRMTSSPSYSLTGHYSLVHNAKSFFFHDNCLILDLSEIYLNCVHSSDIINCRRASCQNNSLTGDPSSVHPPNI